MGLAKLVVDVESLTALLLEDQEGRYHKFEVDDIPPDSRIVDYEARYYDDKPVFIIVLSHADLPEPAGMFKSDELLVSHVTITSFEITEDQQDRLNAYEEIMRNVMSLISQAPALSLEAFNEKLTLLGTKVTTAMRGEDIAEALVKADIKDTLNE